MKIPATTVKPRFYVTTNRARLDRRALSSWDTLAEAHDCIRRFRKLAFAGPRHYYNPYKDDLGSVVCITETGPSGHTQHPLIPPDTSEGVTPP